MVQICGMFDHHHAADRRQGVSILYSIFSTFSFINQGGVPVKKKPTIEFEVEVTRRDIDEAHRLGLTGAQMIERSVEGALQKLENVGDRSLAKRRKRSGRPEFWWRRRTPGRR